MIEPLYFKDISEYRANEEILTDEERLAQKLNEVIVEVNRQEKRWEKLDESMEIDQLCEHPRWKHGTCLSCGGDKPAPAEENTKLPKCACGEPWTLGVVHRKDHPCYFPSSQNEVPAYKAELKQKIEAMKHKNARPHDAPETKTVAYDNALDAVLELLEEEE